MGNEESIGQSGDYANSGQFGANPNMMSSNFNQRTNLGMNTGSVSSSSFPTANRPNPTNKPMTGMSGAFGGRPPGPASSMSAMPAMSPGPGPGPPEVDLSGLTEEEKMIIQSVMAKAEQETVGEVGLSPIRGPPKPMVNKDQNQIRGPQPNQQLNQQKPLNQQHQQQPQQQQHQQQHQQPQQQFNQQGTGDGQADGQWPPTTTPPRANVASQQNQWNQSQPLQSQPMLPTQSSGTRRKMPQMPQQFQNQQQKQQITPQQDHNRQYGQELVQQQQNQTFQTTQQQNKNQFQQDFRQELSETAPDIRQDMRNNQRFTNQDMTNEMNRQMALNSRHDNLNQQMATQQEFRQEIRQQFQPQDVRPSQQLTHQQQQQTQPQELYQQSAHQQPLHQQPPNQPLPHQQPPLQQQQTQPLQQKPQQSSQSKPPYQQQQPGQSQQYQQPQQFQQDIRREPDLMAHHSQQQFSQQTQDIRGSQQLAHQQQHPTQPQELYQQSVHQQPPHQKQHQTQPQELYQQSVQQQPLHGQPPQQQPLHGQPPQQQPLHGQPSQQQPLHQQQPHQQPSNQQQQTQPQQQKLQQSSQLTQPYQQQQTGQSQHQQQPQQPHQFQQDMRREPDVTTHHPQQQYTQQTQRPHEKQQNYSQEEYQRYQMSNQWNQYNAQPDIYQTYPSTSMSSMTPTSTATGVRDMRGHDMGSPSHKTVISGAPIPRTVPLHTVTQQLANSSSVAISPPSSSSSSPKHKTVQSQQQSYAQQLQPKKTPPLVPECWSPPTDLSPILDVSPSIEAAEQEIMEKIKSSGESLSSVIPNIPRATSGTITGMIADFNKAMEALGTTSPTEEQYQIASKLKQLERDSKSNSQRKQSQQNQQTVQTSKQVKNDTNIKNQALVRKSSIDNTSAPQPIIVMSSGPNQSTIPLQLQLNPQALVNSQPLLPSPQVEQQLQQQQILIQQQQQLLQIQIEQQKLQKQMTEQFSIRQQQDIDKQKKEQKEPAVQPMVQPMVQPVVASVATSKPEVVKQDKQVSTSTPPSITSTPTSSSSKQMTTTSSTLTKTSEPLVNTSGVISKKSLHRRLPHPTTEEMQTAVQTLAAHSAAQRTTPSVVSSQILISQQRPISPLLPRKTQQSILSSQTILNPSTRRTNLSTATVLTTATSTLVSSAIMPSTSLYDRISPSPYSLGQSVLRSHTPMTPGGDFSDSQSDVSGDKGKRRKLPSVPFDEDPVSPVLATRKLIKERLAGRPALSSTSIASKRIPPLRPSSSLDSAVTGLANVAAHRRPQSPFSSSSDITQFLASTYGQSVLKSPIGNIRSPARSPIPPGEAQIGRQLTKMSTSSPASPTRFPSYMKNIKQQLWEELKTATEEKYRLMSLRDRDKDFYRRSETDLQTLYDIYSSPVRRRRGRYKSRNASDSRIYRSHSPRDDIPFKSYEFESLNPSRTGIELNYRNQRPMSSLGAYSDTEAGLRESVIPNMMDYNENNLYMAANALNRSVRRRSEGSAEMMARFGYGLDPYGRSSSNYYYDDLTQQRRRVGGVSRGTRSWNPSPYVSEDEDDHLTREEKAAKVRAEIKRRRQQMADTGRLYRHSIDGSGLQYGPVDDIYGQSGLMDEDYYNYNQNMHSMPKDYYNGRLRTNYSQPSLHSTQGHDNYGYQNCEQRMRPTYSNRSGANPRDAALLRRPNFAHPDMGSLMSATESDTPSDVFMEPMLNTPAMPILPDMPTRSRKLLEDLGSSPIAGGGGGGGHRPGYSHNMMRGSPKKTQFAPNTTKYPKYPFPVKRILLTQDPKIRSVSGNGLGLKVVGGQEIPGSNMIGAYIQKIHPSLTMMGEIREGMQVIEWNGIPLTGISHDEVSRIISTQVGDEIEVVIRTDINMMANQSYQNYEHQSDAYPQVILQHNHPVDESHHQMPAHSQQSHQQQYPQYQQQQHQQIPHPQQHNPQIEKSVDSQQVVEPIDQQSYDVVNDDQTEFDINEEHLGRIQGQIQLQIVYDMKAAILYVTIIEAQNLMRLSSGESPDPFVKCYLLPPRIVDNQRRTRYFSRCLSPKWNQTMVYPNIQLEDFKRKYLEISVWSFCIYTPHIFLGQINIDLSEAYIFDEDSHWYRLGGLNNQIKIKTNTFKYPITEKRILRREDINIEKWQYHAETYTSIRQPIIATSTRNKFTILGERLNRQIERRRSCSSTESSRIIPQTGITAHPLLQHGCRVGTVCTIL